MDGPANMMALVRDVMEVTRSASRASLRGRAAGPPRTRSTLGSCSPGLPVTCGLDPVNFVHSYRPLLGMLLFSLYTLLHQLSGNRRLPSSWSCFTSSWPTLPVTSGPTCLPAHRPDKFAMLLLLRRWASLCPVPEGVDPGSCCTWAWWAWGWRWCILDVLFFGVGTASLADALAL